MNIVLLSLVLGSLWIPFQNVRAPKVTEGDNLALKSEYVVIHSYVGEVTAYTSREIETDDTPFITADGSRVHWGIVATNAYPFGTHVRFPDIYEDQIFIVRDRMNTRYKNRLDIWMPEYDKARRFGIKRTYVEIVEPNAELDHLVLQ